MPTNEIEELANLTIEQFMKLVDEMAKTAIKRALENHKKREE